MRRITWLVALVSVALPFTGTAADWSRGVRHEGSIHVDFGYWPSGEPVYSVSHDCRLLAVTTGGDTPVGPTIIYDLVTRERLARVVGEVVEFSPDDRKLATRAEDELLIWSVPDGTELARFTGQPAHPVFSADSRYAVLEVGVEGDGWRIAVESLADRTPRADAATEYRVTMDGRLYAIPSGDQVGQVPLDDPVENFVSTAGEYAVTIADGLVKVLTVPDLDQVGAWPGVNPQFLGDGALLFTRVPRGEREVHRIYRVADGQQVVELTLGELGEGGPDSDLRGRYVSMPLSTEAETYTQLYDTADGRLLGRVRGYTGAHSPEGNWYVSHWTADPKREHLIALPSLRRVATLLGVQGMFTRDGNRIISVVHDGGIRIYVPAD